MLNIINFGSLNVDHVYSVEHFVRPGETISSTSYGRFCGGKGLNQSVALANAGAHVHHVGKIGSDGIFLRERLTQSNVDTSYLLTGQGASGHAMIQVNSIGENSIVLFGGENQNILLSEIEKALTSLKETCSYLLLQNEINNISDIMKLASSLGFKIIFNAAPMDSKITSYPLNLVDIFLLNEIEGSGLTFESDSDNILEAMRKIYPKASTLLTLGPKGAVYQSGDEKISVPAEKVDPIDTTGAGDTFIGFFLAHLLSKKADINYSLKIASRAAAACIGKKGAVDSIPLLKEIL